MRWIILLSPQNVGSFPVRSTGSHRVKLSSNCFDVITQGTKREPVVIRPLQTKRFTTEVPYQGCVTKLGFGRMFLKDYRNVIVYHL